MLENIYKRQKKILLWIVWTVFFFHWITRTLIRFYLDEPGMSTLDFAYMFILLVSVVLIIESRILLALNALFFGATFFFLLGMTVSYSETQVFVFIPILLLLYVFLEINLYRKILFGLYSISHTLYAMIFVQTQGPTYDVSPIYNVMTYVNVPLAFILVLLLSFFYLSMTHEKDKHLIMQANQDALTRIHNRKAMLDIVQEYVKKSKIIGTPPFGIIYLDLDHFKHINDNYGHPVGDEVIRWMIEVVTKQLRHTSSFGRIGGEEFVILVPDVDLEGIKKVCERVVKAVAEQPFQNFRYTLDVTISAGATLINKQDSLESLLKRADVLMYRAKENGRNTYVISQ